MRVTFIHAPRTFQQRLQLWEEIRQIHVTNVLPWVCIGDFNKILYYWEKVEKRMAENFRMTTFRDFLDSCELMELESKGCAFTWANNREGEEFVKE